MAGDGLPVLQSCLLKLFMGESFILAANAGLEGHKDRVVPEGYCCPNIL